MTVRSHPDEPRHPRVLLAEDDDDSRSLIKQTLGAGGFRVTECRDGSELFTELSPLLPPQGPLEFDLIIVDPSMLGASWLEVVAALNADDVIPPVLLIEGSSERVPDVDIAGLPIAGHIDSPLDGESVVSAARNCIHPMVGQAAHERRGDPCW